MDIYILQATLLLLDPSYFNCELTHFQTLKLKPLGKEAKLCADISHSKNE